MRISEIINTAPAMGINPVGEPISGSLCQECEETMKFAVLLAATLWPALQPAQAGAQTPPAPLRNTFVVAAETVIDDANAVDLKADDTHFDGQMQTLKTARENLNRMASEDREHEIVSSADDMIFAISACHIQAKDGGNTAKCQTQVDNARTRTMEVLDKHKSAGAWVDGPPA